MLLNLVLHSLLVSNEGGQPISPQFDGCSEPRLLHLNLSTGGTLGNFLESKLGGATGRALVLFRQVGPCLWSLCKDVAAVLAKSCQILHQ